MYWMPWWTSETVAARHFSRATRSVACASLPAVELCWADLLVEYMLRPRGRPPASQAALDIDQYD